MPDEALQEKTKSNLTIRDVPAADHAAIERMRKKLRMKREPFLRALLHRAAWGAPFLFERDLRDALGPEPEDEDEEADESE